MALNVKDEPVDDMFGPDDGTCGREQLSPCGNNAETKMSSSLSSSSLSSSERHDNGVDMTTESETSVSAVVSRRNVSMAEMEKIGNKMDSQQREKDDYCRTSTESKSRSVQVNDSEVLNAAEDTNFTKSPNDGSLTEYKLPAANSVRIGETCEVKSAVVSGQNFVRELEQFVASVSVPSQRPTNRIHAESSIHPHVSKRASEPMKCNNISEKIQSSNVISKNIFTQSQTYSRSPSNSYMATNRSLYERGSISETPYRSRSNIIIGEDQPIDLSVRKSGSERSPGNILSLMSAELSSSMSSSYISPLSTDTENARSTLAALEEKFGARSSILNEIGTRTASLSDRFGFACSGSSMYESGALLNGYHNTANSLLNSIQKTTNNNLCVKNNSQNDSWNGVTESTAAAHRSRNVSRDSDEILHKVENHRQTSQSRKAKSNGTLFTAQREMHLCDFINDAARRDKVGVDPVSSHRGKVSPPSLHCLECRAVFHSLQELTVHMIRTEHYLNIVGAQDLLYQTNQSFLPNLKPPAVTDDEQDTVSPNSSTDSKSNVESPPLDEFGNFVMYWKSMSFLQMQSLRQASALKPVMFFPPVKNPYSAEDSDMFNPSDFLARRAALYVDPDQVKDRQIAKLEEDESPNISSTGIEHSKTDSSYTGSPLSRLSTSSSDTTDSTHISHGPKSRDTTTARLSRKRAGNQMELERKIITRNEDYELKPPAAKHMSPNSPAYKIRGDYQRYREIDNLSIGRRFSNESSEPSVRQESDSFRPHGDKYIQESDNFNHPGTPSALTSLQNLVYGSADRHKVNSWLSKPRMERDSCISSRYGLQKPGDLTHDILSTRNNAIAVDLRNTANESETKPPYDLKLIKSDVAKGNFISSPVCDSTQENKDDKDYHRTLKLTQENMDGSKHGPSTPNFQFTLPSKALSRDVAMNDEPKSSDATINDKADVLRRPFSTPAILYGNCQQRRGNETMFAEVNQSVTKKYVYTDEFRQHKEPKSVSRKSFYEQLEANGLLSENKSKTNRGDSLFNSLTRTRNEAGNFANNEAAINWSRNETMSRSSFKSVTAREFDSGRCSWKQDKDSELTARMNVDKRESPNSSKETMHTRTSCETRQPSCGKTIETKQIASNYDAHNRFARYYELAKELQGKP